MSLVTSVIPQPDGTRMITVQHAGELSTYLFASDHDLGIACREACLLAEAAARAAEPAAPLAIPAEYTREASRLA